MALHGTGSGLFVLVLTLVVFSLRFVYNTSSIYISNGKIEGPTSVPGKFDPMLFKWCAIVADGETTFNKLTYHLVSAGYFMTE